MANLSNYTESLIATWLAGGAAPSTLPTTLYLDLYSTPPNAETGTGGTSICSALTGVARLSLNNTSNAYFYSEQNNNFVKNNEILITQSALATVSNITGFAIWTQIQGGNMLYSGSIQDSPKTITIGQSARFAQNAMVLTID